MASRDGDTALWLHNKLGSTDDLWSGKSICSQLTQDKLQSIHSCFRNLQPHVKAKLMLSFLHLARRNIEEWKDELEEILDLAVNDTDQWVSMIGEIMRSFPSTGALNLDIEENSPTCATILLDLKKLVKKSTDARMLPLECLYLNLRALQTTAGAQPIPIKHFALKRKPKSAALRAELLQKSQEAANNKGKSSTVNSIPVKMRSFAKKMDDPSPFRSLNRSGSSNSSSGFLRSPNPALGRMNSSMQRTAPGRKEGGIKFLDITEMPLGSKEAKRRKKQQDAEAAEQQKKEKEAAASTPDYAAGLLQQSISSVPNTGPSYLPTTVNRLPTASGGSVTLPTSAMSSATQQARENLQQQLQQQLGQSQLRLQNTAQQMDQSQQRLQSNENSQQSQTQQPQQPQPQQNPPKKGLSLTREQMLEAQEMFRNSNKVTRPEKALILGFMAGSRDNPCPQQGDIVNIRLSETVETVTQQLDGTARQMMADTFFQMNYTTGTWKRIKKIREMGTQL